MKGFRAIFLVTGFLVLSLLLENCANDSEGAVKTTETSEPLIVETDEPGIQDADLKISNTLPTEGMEDGEFGKYYQDGTLQVKGYVVAGKRSGVWTYFHPTGNKQSENNYINGELDGKTVVYYPNGQVMYIGYYSSGKSDGQWLYFDMEGTLTQEVLYKNGEVVSIIEKNEKPS